MKIDDVKMSDVMNGFMFLSAAQTNLGQKIAYLTFELSLLSIDYETLTKKLKKEIDEVQKILAKLGGDEE